MSQRIPMVVSITLAVLLAGLSSSFIHAESADVAAGKRIYVELCKTCHGLDGRGPGVMKFSPHSFRVRTTNDSFPQSRHL